MGHLQVDKSSHDTKSVVIMEDNHYCVENLQASASYQDSKDVNHI